MAQKMLNLAGINKGFVFVLPDTHGSVEIERNKLLDLQKYGLQDVFVEGLAANSDLRAGEFMLFSELKALGFNVLALEDEKLLNRGFLAMDIFYVLAYKFDNLFMTLDCFQDDMRNNIKFLSVHESLDHIISLTKRDFDYEFDLCDLDPQKAEQVLRAFAEQVLGPCLMDERNQAFVKNLDKALQKQKTPFCAVVVGKAHVKKVTSCLKAYNVIVL